MDEGPWGEREGSIVSLGFCPGICEGVRLSDSAPLP